jgi:hypothetical protein
VNVYDGLCSVDELPSPNVHNQAVGELADPSINVTFRGKLPDVGVALKAATGSKSAADTGRENSRMINTASRLVDAVIFFMILPKYTVFCELNVT